MNVSVPPPAQATGSQFDAGRMLAARERSWVALREIARRIMPGMTEPQAVALAGEVLADAGMQRIWHPSLIRFGVNTLKTFRERSVPDIRLGERDIFFVDLGPV